MLTLFVTDRAKLGVRKVVVFAVPYHISILLLHMSSSPASPSLADRLVTACANGDLPSANAAVADGASVNEKGLAPGWGTYSPLAAAVVNSHHAVVVWLLSHGADPNGNAVIAFGTCSTGGILELLIDAGGDVNQRCDGWRPLFAAVFYGREDNLRVLLAQPATDLKEYGHENRKGGLSGVVSQEVSGQLC